MRVFSRRISYLMLSNDYYRSIDIFWVLVLMILKSLNPYHPCPPSSFNLPTPITLRVYTQFSSKFFRTAAISMKLGFNVFGIELNKLTYIMFLFSVTLCVSSTKKDSYPICKNLKVSKFVAYFWVSDYRRSAADSKNVM